MRSAGRSGRTAARLGLWMLLMAALGLTMGAAAGSTGWQAPWRVWQDPTVWPIVVEIRLPRSVGAWLAGALLGLAGAVAQGVFRNPLADPFLLGSASGASLGVCLYLSLFGASLALAWPWTVQLGMTGAAFVGALAAVLITLTLSRGVQHTLRLLLAGVIVGVTLGAVTSWLSLLRPEVLRTMQGFMLGSAAWLDWAACLQMALALLAGLILSWPLARLLDALSLGENTARSLGLPVEAGRLFLVLVLALATAAAVAKVGLVAFVGLAAPHAVRAVVSLPHRHRVPLSACVGGNLLLLADVLARSLMAPQDLPVGLLTAALGGGYLLLRLSRQQGGEAAA